MGIHFYTCVKYVVLGNHVFLTALCLLGKQSLLHSPKIMLNLLALDVFDFTYCPPELSHDLD